ncbi:hypothetical protein DPMN_026988 [Dreissena polymorpha]|uniref:Uncharacterized protein n=1 Tax=Dreissena polymorpha TaxID=45954 RepID=A0A9D4LTJ9_DREPO|nr:hypothetical protein DPMN_026988 [Dreissena polymorpha]
MVVNTTVYYTFLLNVSRYAQHSNYTTFRYNNNGSNYRDNIYDTGQLPNNNANINGQSRNITSYNVLNDHINFNNKSSVKRDNKYFTRQRTNNYDSNVARYLNIIDEYSINDFFVGK